MCVFNGGPKVEDAGVLGRESEAAIDLIIQGLGILVGFSWEQCFDVAVSVVSASAKDSMPPCYSRLLMSMVLVAIVFPAWRIYILRTEQELIEEIQHSTPLQ